VCADMKSALSERVFLIFVFPVQLYVRWWWLVNDVWICLSLCNLDFSGFFGLSLSHSLTLCVQTEIVHKAVGSVCTAAGLCHLTQLEVLPPHSAQSGQIDAFREYHLARQRERLCVCVCVCV
jgi:hypothetical protein